MKGNPKKRDISISLVERQNLTMRMQMRRFTRLTNAFSKKVENLGWAVSLHFMHSPRGRPPPEADFLGVLGLLVCKVSALLSSNGSAILFASERVHWRFSGISFAGVPARRRSASETWTLSNKLSDYIQPGPTGYGLLQLS